MNEEIKTRLMNYLDIIENTVEKTGDFAAEQIPLYVQELLNWMFYESLFNIMTYLFLCILLCIPAIVLRNYIKKITWEQFNIDTGNDGFAEFISGVTIIIALFGLIPLYDAINSAKLAVKTCVAPRVVLLEEIRKLSK